MMTRLKAVNNYLMKITQSCDQLVAVGEKVEDSELVNMALKGFPASREPFVKGICARQNLLSFERLWDDCIQEEIGMESKADKKDGEENLALFGWSNKGKGKGLDKGKGKSEESSSQIGKKNLCKIKCFLCHKNNHYASQCREKKDKRK
jgi:hypothetical protein